MCGVLNSLGPRATQHTQENNPICINKLDQPENITSNQVRPSWMPLMKEFVSTHGKDVEFVTCPDRVSGLQP